MECFLAQATRPQAPIFCRISGDQGSSDGHLHMEITIALYSIRILNDAGLLML